jgi:hypothetical protein
LLVNNKSFTLGIESSTWLVADKDFLALKVMVK